MASACGVAAKALWPSSPWSTEVWSGLHAAAGYALVRWWGYRGFERLMQGLMSVMFVTVLLCAVLMPGDLGAIFEGLLWPTVPPGSVPLLLGAMGGVGGSVTLLCYGYWLREKQWRGEAMHGRTLWDLGTAYALTGFFGLAVVVIAATVKPADASGNALVLALAGQLGQVLGPAGKWCFLAGFWCAVFTSLLGVWQGVPYLWADSVRTLRRKEVPAEGLTRSRAYRWFLLYLAFPPLLLLIWQRPLAIVVLYAIAGAFFMPFLGATLLWMNNRRDWVGSLRNRWSTNVVLGSSLVLFLAVFAL
ncbi:MAG: Nramp family divalent metal transporter [Cephaloticoccus sp.]